MEEIISQGLQYFVAKFPIVAAVYSILTSAYAIFCVVTTWTTTKKDDAFRDKIKVFFSVKTTNANK